MEGIVSLETCANSLESSSSDPFRAAGGGGLECVLRPISRCGIVIFVCRQEIVDGGGLY